MDKDGVRILDLLTPMKRMVNYMEEAVLMMATRYMQQFWLLKVVLHEVKSAMM